MGIQEYSMDITVRLVLVVGYDGMPLPIDDSKIIIGKILNVNLFHVITSHCIYLIFKCACNVKTV